MTKRENYNAYMAEYMKNRSIRLKFKAIEYKGGKCIKCGYCECHAALQFHHRDPTQKEMGWRRLRARKWSIVEKELDKCDLLCGNCHTEEHFDENILKRVEEWEDKIKIRESAKAKIKGTKGSCLQCGQDFTRKKGDRKDKKYCSLQCARKSSEVTNWPEPKELKDMVLSQGIHQISKVLMVSEETIRRRIRRKLNDNDGGPQIQPTNT